jgi:hypothetical protein
MSESAFFLLLVGVMAACAVVMTVTVVMTARELRRTSRRVNALVPPCRRALGQTQALLTSTHRISRHVESVILKASGAASHTIDQFLGMKNRVEQFLHDHLNDNGKGAGGGPRLSRNRLGGKRRDV